MIGVIGTDAQIEQVLNITERNKEFTSTINPDDFKLTSVLLSDTSPLVGKTPVSANLRERYEVLVVAVRRGDEYIDSDPHLKFTPGDIVWLVGNIKALSTL